MEKQLTAEQMQKLYNYLAETFNCMPLESEMRELIDIVSSLQPTEPATEKQKVKQDKLDVEGKNQITNLKHEWVDYEKAIPLLGKRKIYCCLINGAYPVTYTANQLRKRYDNLVTHILFPCPPLPKQVLNVTDEQIMEYALETTLIERKQGYPIDEWAELNRICMAAKWMRSLLSPVATEPATEKEPVVKDGFEKYLEETANQISKTTYSGGTESERKALYKMDERITNIYNNILTVYKSFSPVSQTKDTKEQKGKEITDKTKARDFVAEKYGYKSWLDLVDHIGKNEHLVKYNKEVLSLLSSPSQQPEITEETEYTLLKDKKPRYYALVICKIKNSKHPVLLWRAGTIDDDIWTISGTGWLFKEEDIEAWKYFAVPQQPDSSQTKGLDITDEEIMNRLQKPLDAYILERHNQDRVMGFIDGFEKALLLSQSKQETETNKQNNMPPLKTYEFVDELNSNIKITIQAYGYELAMENLVSITKNPADFILTNK